MSETRKTVWFAGVAVVLALLAFIIAPKRITPEAFLDQGEPFFRDFLDPNTAITLEVIDYDESSGRARPFKVTFEDNAWTIPSHHDYAADARDRLARTAAGVIDIKKDDFRTANVVDHEDCGVIDPLDETIPGLTGRGSRITIKGAGEQVLADFIVGKEVPERQGFRFVRVPGQNRVYACRMNIDISTRFADWIDTDLLRVAKKNIEKIILNDYSINERTRTVDQGDIVDLTFVKDGWHINSTREGFELDTAGVRELVTALDELSIVGVRPKPEGLSASLVSGAEEKQISQTDRFSLQSKGFYFSRDNQLLSNEGELNIHTTGGVVYTLRFGEVLYGSGLAVTAGLSESVEGEKQDEESEGRYLFVTTEFDSRYFRKPPEPRSTAFLDKADSLWTDEDKEDRKRQDELTAWQKSTAKGQALSDSLNTRFAAWYYVISGDSFDKIHPSREDLLAEKED